MGEAETAALREALAASGDDRHARYEAFVRWYEAVCDEGERIIEELRATEAVREPALREPEAVWMAAKTAFGEVRRRHVHSPSDGADAFDAAIGDALNEAENAILLRVLAPVLREHQGRDAEVAGPPQIDVERLARALDAQPHLVGSNLFIARFIAHEYARLASTDNPDPAS